MYTSVLLLMLVAGVSASAQDIGANLTGVVRDQTAAIIPGATVTATDIGTDAKRSVVTSETGQYVLRNLSPAEYRITAQMPGFKTAVREGVRLSVGQDAVVDVTLEVGSTTDMITVVGDAPLVQTQDASLSNLIDEATLKNLPLNGRDYMRLAVLTTGVSEARSMGSGFNNITGGGLRIVANGARPDYNMVRADGVDMQDAYNYTPGSAAGVTLGVDTLREFRILKGDYSAEFGRAGGAVINTVTKSGTNEFHGSAFEFHRNTALDTRNFFDIGAPPHHIRNQFGFTLGGPIVKDKTFFFGSYEGLRDRLGRTARVNVPTRDTHDGYLPMLNGRYVPYSSGGVRTLVGINPIIKPYLDMYPLPTPGGIDNQDGTAQYIRSISTPTNEDFYLVRIDHQLTPSQAVFGRYSIDDSKQINANAIAPFSQQNFARRQLATLEDKMTLSQTIINIVRLGFNRANTGQQNIVPSGLEKLGFVPGKTMGQIGITGVGSIGTERQSDIIRVWNHYELTDSVYQVMGRHSLSYGTNYKRIQVNGLQGFARFGQFFFQDLSTFLQGTSSTLDVALLDSNLSRGYRMWLWSGFVQDDWSVSRSLVVNAGLRYDFVSVPSEVNGLISSLPAAFLDGGGVDNRVAEDANFVVGGSFYKNPSKLNFGPRLGLAWDVSGDGKTSIRAGGGVFYAPILPANFQIGGFSSPPFTFRLNIPNPLFPTGWINRDVTELKKNLLVQPMDSNPGQPVLYQYNLTTQREILRDLVVSLGYAGSRGVHLSRKKTSNMNRFVFRSDGSKFFPVGTSRPNKNFIGGIVGTTFDTRSAYDSMQLEVRKRFAGGQQIVGSYTWSKSMDASAGDHGGSSGGVTATMDPFDWKRDWALSSFHVKHNFTLSMVNDIPFPIKNGFAAHALGGWQAAGIVRIASGIPVNINNAGQFDQARAATFWIGDEGGTQRPDLVAGKSANPVIKNFDPNVGYLDASSFRLQEAGTFGNLGRNTVIGPGLAVWDASLVKNHAFGDRSSLQFRAEFFNVLNHTNFGTPSGIVFRNNSGVPSPTFGRISGTSTTSRQIQLAMRLMF